MRLEKQVDEGMLRLKLGIPGTSGTNQGGPHVIQMPITNQSDLEAVVEETCSRGVQ